MAKQNLASLIEQKKLKEVMFVSWEESERGWGTRPDGCSLHLSETDANRFIKDYWSEMPSEVPDEYSRPAGRPTTAYVASKLYGEIKKSKMGVRLFSNQLREVYKSEFFYGDEVDGWRIRD